MAEKRRRWPIVLGVVVAVLAGIWALAFFGSRYAFDTLASSAAVPTAAPSRAKDLKTTEEIKDHLRYLKVKEDVGSAMLDMKKMNEYALKLQVDKIKDAGIELTAKATTLEAEAMGVQDPAYRQPLLDVIDGLKTVGRGAADSDPDVSLQGVEQTLKAFGKLPA